MKTMRVLEQVVFKNKKEIKQLPAGSRIHIFGDGKIYEVMPDGIRLWQPDAFMQQYIIRFDDFGLYDYKDFYVIKTPDGNYI